MRSWRRPATSRDGPPAGPSPSGACSRQRGSGAEPGTRPGSSRHPRPAPSPEPPTGNRAWGGSGCSEVGGRRLAELYGECGPPGRGLPPRRRCRPRPWRGGRPRDHLPWRSGQGDEEVHDPGLQMDAVAVQGEGPLVLVDQPLAQPELTQLGNACLRLSLRHGLGTPEQRAPGISFILIRFLRAP